MYDNELQHYGVLGMKWGVRKNPQKTLTKASNKLHKLHNKTLRRQEKANTAAQKAENKANSFFATEAGIRKKVQKANRKQNKANRASYKTYKWYKAMEKTFVKTDVVSLSEKDVSLGKAYVERQNAISVSRFESRYGSGADSMRIYDGNIGGW